MSVHTLYSMHRVSLILYSAGMIVGTGGLRNKTHSQEVARKQTLNLLLFHSLPSVEKKLIHNDIFRSIILKLHKQLLSLALSHTNKCHLIDTMHTYENVFQLHTMHVAAYVL